MKFKFVLIVLFGFLVQLQAQTTYKVKEELNFKNYTTEEGLSQRSVVAIAQDQQGYLWFGTRYGLNRFDGHEFKNYYYDATNENSLSNSWIKVLYKDGDGTLWIGTKNGLNTYNPKTDSFDRVLIPNKENKPFKGEIFDIISNGNKGVWVASDNGLTQMHTGLEANSFNTSHAPEALNSDRVLALLREENNVLWVATSKSILLYDLENNQIQTYSYPEGQYPETTKNYHTVLFKDSSGTVWLGYNGGLARLNKDSLEFIDLKSDNNTKRITSPVRTIFEDDKKNLWIGSYNGLYIFNSKNNEITHYENNPENPKSVSQNSIYRITKDSRGDIWIGTWAGGVNYLNRKSNVFKNYQIGPNGLNYPVVSSIVETKVGNLWIGTEGGGLNYFDRSTNRFTYYVHNNANKNSISSNNIKGIVKGQDNNLWVGTHDKGLSFASFQNKNLAFENWEDKVHTFSNFSNNRTTCLLKDNANNLWVGTDNRGLNYYDTKTGKSYRIGDPDGILGNFITVIVQSKHEKVLLVGSEKGLGSIATDTKEITPIQFKEDTKTPYNIRKVISIYHQSEHQYWIGTEGDGLYSYNSDSKQSVRYGINNGLPDEVIYGILPDDQGHIWLSTNKGLSRLNVSTNEIKNYSQSDGLVNNEFNYGAYLKTKKGELVFGGINGFTVFDPRKIEQDSFIPPVLIENLRIANTSENKVGHNSSDFKLAYNENDISIDYIALDYSRPRNNQYAYMLEGFDSKWNLIGNQTKATYTNLDPGNYTFLVKASNSDGVWNGKITSLDIHISPPFWLTWWAYLIYAILFVSTFLLIRRYTLIRIKERHDLRKERQEKTQIQELNQLKLQLFTNISHDFRTPLTLITAPLQRLIDEKKGDAQMQRQLTGMQRNARILLQLINQLLDFRKAENGKLKLAFSKNDVIPFIEETKASFNDLARDKAIQFELNVPEPPLEVWFDRIEMKKVVLNILSNAFKFTPPNGKISIDISSEANEINIKVKDSGRGIHEKDIEFVFDRYYQLGQKNDLRSGTGVGLALAKDIVELHNGQIQVESELGKGSCFTICLPLGKEHINPELLSYDEYNNETDLLDYYDPSILKSTWVKDEIDNETDSKRDDNKQTILIVEDNIEVRTFVKGIFNKEFNILEANNGFSGINLAKNKSIDLIISDVMMPEMGGIEMCETLKSDVLTSHIPVILLTARTSSKIQKIGFETGADAYVTKPFEADLLKLQVQNLLATRQKLVKKFRTDLVLEPSELELVSTDEVFLKNAMDIVEKNIASAELNASFLSENINMSQSVLYRKLKALTGNTISEFIRGVRLKRAGQLLLETELNINDVAYEVGFNDIKYFRSCFKKAYGKTPSAFKKQANLEVKNI
ncbi:hybrid sensor histidine kinase/response regulator transcription factor [uncultured Zobellia sp.]|uniref:hybrid sensor histidine kinase/response regulator transcription factor n=1 Tax=uncultured Zobellia sp. TaxID=255433 RepID=UPI0025930E69|nr:hybrid sensor histidine kinase/response regulator transcription factor [uncultured Zobellia sp.]